MKSLLTVENRIQHNRECVQVYVIGSNYGQMSLGGR